MLLMVVTTTARMAVVIVTEGRKRLSDPVPQTAMSIIRIVSPRAPPEPPRYDAGSQDMVRISTAITTGLDANKRKRLYPVSAAPGILDPTT